MFPENGFKFQARFFQKRNLNLDSYILAVVLFLDFRSKQFCRLEEMDICGYKCIFLFGNRKCPNNLCKRFHTTFQKKWDGQ